MRGPLLLPLLATTAFSCGVLVHNTVVRTATHLFSLPTTNPNFTDITPHFARLLSAPSNAPAIQAGAFFPDWGYQCISSDADAEAAHWPPFLLAAVQHIRKKYPADARRDGEVQAHVDALTSFIFALVSHQVADATWHSIRMPNGLLHAMSARDFGGDEAAAHRTLDVGGDFLAAERMQRAGGTGWVQRSWFVPVRDLLEIYEAVGRTPAEMVVRYCMTRGLAALRSVLLVGPGLVEPFVASSPMLQTEVEGYHLGGIREMAARTAGCWGWVARWIVLGVPEEEKSRRGWGVCDVFQAIAGKGGAGRVKEGNRVLAENKVMQKMREEIKGVEVSTDKFGAERYTFAPLDLPSPPKLQRENAHGYQDPVQILGTFPHSQLGASVALGNIPERGDIIVVSSPWKSTDAAQPGAGDIRIATWSELLSLRTFPNNPQPLSTFPDPEPLANSPISIDSRFSTALALFTISTQHYLAVSTPGPLATSASPSITIYPLSPPLPPQTHRLPTAALAYPGRRWPATSLLSIPRTPLLLTASPHSDLLLPCPHNRWHPQTGELLLFEVGVNGSLTHLPPLPTPEVLRCTTHARLGESLALTPTARLLLAGAPGVGKAFVYRFTEPAAFTLSHTISAPASEKEGSGDFAATLAVGTTAGREWVAIAAPGEEVRGIRAAGVVRVYAVPGWTLVKVLVAKKAEAGGRFGTVLTADKGVLWVASEWAGAERGAVWRVDINIEKTSRELRKRSTEQQVLGVKEGEGKEVVVDEVEVTAWGSEENGRFGRSVAVGERGVVVGVPGAGEGNSGVPVGGLAVFVGA